MDTLLSVGSSVAASVMTTLIVMWIRSSVMRRDRERAKLRLVKAHDGEWRVRNVSRRRLHGLQAVVFEGDASPRDRAAAGFIHFENGKQLPLDPSDELTLWGLEPGDTVRFAWTYRAGSHEIATAEAWIAADQPLYDLVERPLTYGWGYGPH